MDLAALVLEVWSVRFYPPVPQLNKANAASVEAHFLDLHLSIASGFVSSEVCDSGFGSDIVNFPFNDGGVFHAVLLVVCAFRGLLGFLGSAVLLRTSML